VEADRHDSHRTLRGRLGAVPRARWLSLLEVIVGSAIVLGDNIWGILPNSVVLLCVLALISFRLREGSWSAMGLKRPASWTRTLLVALLAVVVQQLLGQFVVDPLTRPFLRYSAVANPLAAIHGTAGLLRWLGIIWTYAAFGEEIGYRGYLLNRVADLGGHGRVALLFGLLWSSALFGCAHAYQGPAGVMSAMVSGLVFGSAYLLTGRNLWTSICAHGVSDSLALILTLTGMAG
jgi:CAAX protease family protein